MSEQDKSFQKRHVAYKVKISDILNSNFAKDELSAGYVKLNNIDVSRVNIIGTLVYKAEQEGYASTVIDDGTGRILLRSFENVSIFSKIDVSDIVLVVGRIREFNNEKYLIPEILKKINIEWLNIRKLELMKNDNVVNGRFTSKGVSEEVSADINEDVFLLIKKLDNGDGVSIEDLIKSSNNDRVESIINRLLESGDIFEIKPGKLKVLE